MTSSQDPQNIGCKVDALNIASSTHQLGGRLKLKLEKACVGKGIQFMTCSSSFKPKISTQNLVLILQKYKTGQILAFATTNLVIHLKIDPKTLV